MGEDQPNPPPSLEDLDRRLKQAKGDTGSDSDAGRSAPNMPGSAFGMAMRIGLELVVGVGVGVGIGWALDDWLGTKPWLLLLFFFLGAGAGMMNVVRAMTNQGMAMGYTKPAPDDKSPSKGGNDDPPTKGDNDQQPERDVGSKTKGT